MPEIDVNPLKNEIFRVFANNKQRMTFEDFLNMMSVFSENAPFLVKCHYAFKIFGKS
jgi:calcium and integrin-binding protein 1